MFGTIQGLQHHVRTAFGDSKEFFAANTGNVPIQGVGQGNGAGPQIWALVSTPIFNMLREMRYGINYNLPSQTRTCCLWDLVSLMTRIWRFQITTTNWLEMRHLLFRKPFGPGKADCVQPVGL
jgi:hypothetical protein